MLSAIQEPINSYLIQCVVFMSIVPVVATIAAIIIAFRMKKKSKADAVNAMVARVRQGPKR